MTIGTLFCFGTVALMASVTDIGTLFCFGPAALIASVTAYDTACDIKDFMTGRQIGESLARR
jgi:hypothetical protein